MANILWIMFKVLVIIFQFQDTIPFKDRKWKTSTKFQYEAVFILTL
jgi:hypothetical protein